MTDQSGFFSLPALEGDTISFSSNFYITRTVLFHQAEKEAESA